MAFEFNIPELLIISNFPRGGTPYAPLLATSLNKLLRTRVKEEYQLLLKQATEIVFDYEAKTVAEYKDYGFADKNHFIDLPIFQPMFFEKDEDGEDDLYLDSAILTLSRTKNIVKTIVQGRDTSVKEFINNGDWLIEVSGILCEKTWKYPINKTKEFNRWMEKNQALKVNHEILTELGIYQIVIDDYSLPKTPHINCQPYRFTASSDTPLPLLVDDLNEFDSQLT